VDGRCLYSDPNYFFQTWKEQFLGKFHQIQIQVKYELDPQSLFGSCVQLYSMADTPQLPPSLAFGIIYEGAIGQPR
jgi:hypothetical protein